MMHLELLAAFFLGGSAYGAIELLWRGHTHWTMVVTGGFCYVFIYLIASWAALGRWRQYILCAAVITAREFVVGSIVNVRLGWAVWDYSRQPMNLYGQICARYAAYWFFLSIPGCALARATRRLLLRLLG